MKKKFAKLLGYDPIAKETTFKTEVIAGIVTFLAMAYILTLNPTLILSDTEYSALWPSLFIATGLAAVVGTLLMAFVAKMPLAQASGMGLNTMMAGMIGIGAASQYGVRFTVGQSFMMVLIAGIIVLVLSVIKIKGKTFRELIFDAMPVPVRGAICVGIGLFIAYIGFQKAGIIVSGATISGLVSFTNWEACKGAILALIGLFIIAIFDKFNVKGAVVLGIVSATIIGVPFGLTDIEVLAGNSQVSWKFWENFANFFTFGENSVFGSFTSVFTEGFPEGSGFAVVMLIITICMINMFDAMGTMVGCCGGNRVLSDESGKPYNYGNIMLSDSLATCAGAMLGTSTVVTFVESGAGVSAGGRTGLTALSTATMFALALFAMPLFAVIPSAATAAALIYVGVLMMKNNVKRVDFGNAIKATSAFLTITVMVLSYSITNGIGIGLLSYVLMSIVAYVFDAIKYAVKKEGKPKWEISAVAIVISLLFCVYFFVPVTI